jgi:predicted AAA+ superfamily ATPase
MDLMNQSSESLAGRIAYLEMGPFEVLETGITGSDTNALWVRGGFPESYLAASDRDSLAWRTDFIRSYPERDVPMLGPRVPAETLERLWTMLAHEQAALLNASRLAAALMISAQTVSRYIDLLADLLLVRRLRPFHSNAGKRLVKSPKVFVRDSGIVHALLGIADYNALCGHPVAGGSWEGFVIENLIAAAPVRTIASFYRTAAGAEIDLILEIPGHGLWALEIKRGLSAKPEKGFYLACKDLKPQQRFLVNSGSERYPIGSGLDAIGLTQMARILSDL